jgi:hypothetical protein
MTSLKQRVARKRAEARRNLARAKSQAKIDRLTDGNSFTDVHGTHYYKLAGTVYLSRIVDGKPICIGWIDPK